MLGPIKKAINKSVGALGYRIIRGNSYMLADPVVDGDKLFQRIYANCKEYTWTTKERMYALYKAVQYIVESKIPGDFVECGVWKGGSTMLIAYMLVELKDTKRKIYLYDTYEGMTKPTKEDSGLHGNVDSLSIWKKNQKETHNEWAYSPLSEVQEKMAKTKYPEKNLVFVKGNVEDTVPKIAPKKICLLRLDTDWYESTKHELVHLYPLLVKNGVLLIDDYGHFAGAKKAVDEYFTKKNMLLVRVDYTGRIGVKI